MKLWCNLPRHIEFLGVECARPAAVCHPRHIQYIGQLAARGKVFAEGTAPRPGFYHRLK